jgi:TolB-like protein/Tfp pilus assembly protein PilF
MEACASSEVLFFQDFCLDRSSGDLFRHDKSGAFVPVALGSRTLAILHLFLERPGALVSKQQIIAAVWPGVVIEDSNLTVQISALRRVLDQGRPEGSCIQTISGRGYRFVAAVTRRTSEVGHGPAAASGQDGRIVPRLSVAVLPFQNLSGDPEQEYFADGMVAEIITALSRIRWLFVVSRLSSFTYKRQTVDVQRVGHELGVRYVLEGSVRKAADRLRITVELVDAETAHHVWAERFDPEITDVFVAQDEIAKHVAAAIESELCADNYFRSRYKSSESLDAWQCVTRALFLIRQGRRSAAEAEALCRRAIAIEPCCAQAHSVLAQALIGQRWGAGDTRVPPEAMEAARAALRLDRRDAWGHQALGLVLFALRRHDEAERAFERAVESNPNLASAHAFLGVARAFRGAHEAAVASAERALWLNRRDPVVVAYAPHVMACAHFAAARYADCIACASKTIAADPEYDMAHVALIAAAALEGHSEVADGALSTLLGLRPDFSLAWVRQNTGFAGEVRERLVGALREAGVPE